MYSYIWFTLFLSDYLVPAFSTRLHSNGLMCPFQIYLPIIADGCDDHSRIHLDTYNYSTISLFSVKGGINKPLLQEQGGDKLKSSRDRFLSIIERSKRWLIDSLGVPGTYSYHHSTIIDILPLYHMLTFCMAYVLRMQHWWQKKDPIWHWWDNHGRIVVKNNECCCGGAAWLLKDDEDYYEETAGASHLCTDLLSPPLPLHLICGWVN